MIQFDFIAVNLLRQYHFCPRIPFFSEVMNLKPPRPSWVKKGSEFHKKQVELTRYRKLNRFSVSNSAVRYDDVYMEDIEYGICGKADLILKTESEIYPVEIKMHSSMGKGHLVQSAAYGVLASKKFKREFKKGFILSEKRGITKHYLFDSKIEKLLEDTVKSVRDILTEGNMPDSSASCAQCGQCEFFNFCNDRF